MRVLGIWAISFAFVWVTPLESLASSACYNLFILPPSQELPVRLRVGTFNTQNLGRLPTKDETNAEQMALYTRELERNKQIKKIINELEADILVLTETMDPVSIKQLASRLDEKYSLFWTAGNDPYGKSISMLLKKDLPIVASYESHQHIKWTDPVTGKMGPLFIRDAPAMILRKTGESKPFLIVIGVHSKSQRDRHGDPRSQLRRDAEFDGYISIIHGYQRRYGMQTEIMLVGDLNTNVKTSPEVKKLDEVIPSAFELAKESTRREHLITHTYHPREGETIFQQIDDIRVLPFTKGLVESAKVIRYKNEDGTEKPYPQTFEKRQTQPSDHFPIVVEINTPAAS